MVSTFGLILTCFICFFYKGISIMPSKKLANTGNFPKKLNFIKIEQVVSGC